MSDHTNTPREKQRQGKTHLTQLQTIFQYLSKHVATGSMVVRATGISHKNLTRYKRDLEKSGRLKEVRKGICEATGFKAWYITCDPSKFPAKNQLSFFQ